MKILRMMLLVVILEKRKLLWRKMKLKRILFRMMVSVSIQPLIEKMPKKKLTKSQQLLSVKAN